MRIKILLFWVDPLPWLKKEMKNKEKHEVKVAIEKIGTTNK